MVRRAPKHERGVVKRTRRKMIVVGLEGNNVTESIYLSQFNRLLRNYTIIQARGNYTDPVGIVRSAITTVDKEELVFEEGDLAYCMIDRDFSNAQKKKLCNAIEIGKKNHIDVLISNPTFEIWYLLHFRYSTKEYSSNNEVLMELRKYIPDYSKNKDIFPLLIDKTNDAIENANKLVKYHDSDQVELIDRMPGTDVYKLVDILINDVQRI